MPCFYPQTAYQPLAGGPLEWRERADMRQLTIPCRQCIGCRLKSSAEKATRCMHEASMHRYNSWVTLTYADEHLQQKYYTGVIHPRTNKPIYSGTLHKPHMQDFFRALRKALGRKRKWARSFNHDAHWTTPAGRSIFQKLDALTVKSQRVRYYYGGEYGEKYGRPHYHACIFGVDFADKIYDHSTDTGFRLYTSETLKKLWPHGDHLIGELTWESAAYTARYIMKKINGRRAAEHYLKLDHETGELIQLQPEYNDMSRRPGIAATWLAKFMSDVYPHDHVIVRGHKTRPPRYYDKQLEKKLKFNFNEDDLEGAYAELNKPMEQLKFARHLEAKLHWRDQTDERLKTQETVTKRKIQSLKQKF